MNERPPGHRDLVRVVRQAYEAWAVSRGTDPAPFLDLFAQDVSIVSLGRGREPLGFSRPRERKAALWAYFREFSEQWEMLSYEIDNVIMDGEIVVVLYHSGWRNLATGRSFRTRKADVWHFSGDQAIRFEEFYDTAAMIEAGRSAGPE